MSVHFHQRDTPRGHPVGTIWATGAVCVWHYFAYLLHYISVAAATAGDNTLVTWALQNSNLSVPTGLFLGIYLFHAPQSAEGVRWQDSLS